MFKQRILNNPCHLCGHLRSTSECCYMLSSLVCAFYLPSSVPAPLLTASSLQITTFVAVFVNLVPFVTLVLLNLFIYRTLKKKGEQLPRTSTRIRREWGENNITNTKYLQHLAIHEVYHFLRCIPDITRYFPFLNSTLVRKEKSQVGAETNHKQYKHLYYFVVSGTLWQQSWSSLLWCTLFVTASKLSSTLSSSLKSYQVMLMYYTWKMYFTYLHSIMTSSHPSTLKK